MQVFPSENQECLLEGLMRVFERIGGAPQQALADNMATAVAKVGKGVERELTDGFMRFMLHCRFGAEFCSPASGNEKGSVENKVGYMRRNILAPVPAVGDINASNEELFGRCEDGMGRLHCRHKKSIRELWEEERGHLLGLPANRHGAFRYESCKVDKYGFVSIDSSKHGVSPTLSGKIVQAKAYYDKAGLCHGHRLLGSHTRSCTKGSGSMDWRDYIEAIAHKPRAAENARFSSQLPELWQGHIKALDAKGKKSALLVPREIAADGSEAIADRVLGDAVRHGDVGASSILACYCIAANKQPGPKQLELPGHVPVLGYSPGLGVYGLLANGGGK